MIAVLEGMDACGKATYTKLITEALQSRGIDASHGSFPDYTNLSGQALAKLFKGEWDIADPLTRATVLQSLQTMSRLENRKDIDPFVNNPNRIRILDRYFASGLVYGEADGLPMQVLVDIHSYLPQADLWLLIDIPPEESWKRRPERRDEYERRAGFMEKIRSGYLRLFSDVPPGLSGEWVIIDGMGTVDDVHGRIMRAVDKAIARLPFIQAK